eukprot:2420950-Amphidinium_carterae.1
MYRVFGVVPSQPQATIWTYPVYTYPSTGEPGDDPRAAEEQHPEAPTEIRAGRRPTWGCPACKRGRDMTHTEHTRERVGARNCKYPEVTSIPRRCPGCQHSRHGSHSSHTLEPGDCRFHDLTNRLWRHPGLRIRAAPQHGGAPRDPSQPPLAPDRLTGTLQELGGGQNIEGRTLDLDHEMDLMGPPEPVPLEAVQGPAEAWTRSATPVEQHEQQQLRTALENSIREQRMTTDQANERADVTPGAESLGIRDIRDNYEQGTTGINPADAVRRIPVTPDDIVVARPVATGTIPTTPGRGPDSYQRLRRVYAEDGTQTEGTGQVDWRSFDTSKALRNLASTSARVRLLTLRRLHVRWHHLNTKQMTDVLTAAGAPQAALQEIPLIANSCQICRRWTRPGRRGQTSSNTATDFNQEIQIDLLTYHSITDPHVSYYILHMIDVATRYAQAVVVASKAEKDLCESISVHWIMVFGSPTFMTVDGEKGMHSLFTADWAE